MEGSEAGLERAPTGETLRSQPVPPESQQEPWDVTRLRSALENYGRHHPGCASWQSNAQKYEECNCGLAEALKIGRTGFAMSKEWCLAAAEREGNSEIGVGGFLGRSPVPPEIGTLIDTLLEARRDVTEAVERNRLSSEIFGLREDLDAARSALEAAYTTLLNDIRITQQDAMAFRDRATVAQQEVSRLQAAWPRTTEPSEKVR